MNFQKSDEFIMIHLQRSTLTRWPPLLCWEGSGRTDDIMHCSSQSLILYRQQPTFVSYPAPVFPYRQLLSWMDIVGK
ncbi:hypothetical protein HN51_016520 [Arachis hypogaea]